MIAQLLEYYYKGDILDAVIKVISKVEGRMLLELSVKITRIS